MINNNFLFIEPNLVKKLTVKLIYNKNIYTWSRSSTILPFMLGKSIFVYNGRRHIPIFIQDRFLGRKLGEFVYTRFFRQHKKKDKLLKLKSKNK